MYDDMNDTNDICCCRLGLNLSEFHTHSHSHSPKKVNKKKNLETSVTLRGKALVENGSYQMDKLILNIIDLL